MEATSAVYVLFGHAGLYIGKANLARTRVSAGWVPGLASRCMEHLVGLFIGKSRDASLPRYKVLRGSLASITFFPVAVFASEVRALHVEKILIQALQPSANGADILAFGNLASKGLMLRPSKAARKRPPKPFRSITSAMVSSVWCDLNFQVGLEKVTKQQETENTEKLGQRFRMVAFTATSKRLKTLLVVSLAPYLFLETNFCSCLSLGLRLAHLLFACLRAGASKEWHSSCIRQFLRWTSIFHRLVYA